MSNLAGLGDLVQQIREASANITVRDAKNGKRLDQIAANIDDLYRKVGRPGGFVNDRDDAAFERRSATEMCAIRHAERLTLPKASLLRVGGEGWRLNALLDERLWLTLWRIL